MSYTCFMYKQNIGQRFLLTNERKHNVVQRITKQHKSTGNDKLILKTRRNDVTNDNLSQALIAILLLFSLRPQQQQLLQQSGRERRRQRTRQRLPVG